MRGESATDSEKLILIHGIMHAHMHVLHTHTHLLIRGGWFCERLTLRSREAVLFHSCLLSGLQLQDPSVLTHMLTVSISVCLCVCVCVKYMSSSLSVCLLCLNVIVKKNIYIIFFCNSVFFVFLDECTEIQPSKNNNIKSINITSSNILTLFHHRTSFVLIFSKVIHYRFFSSPDIY